MPTQLPRVPSLIPSSFATLAIGRDVSITIFTASSLNSGEKLFLDRGNYFTFPDGPSYWMDCPEGSGHLKGRKRRRQCDRAGRDAGREGRLTTGGSKGWPPLDCAGVTAGLRGQCRRGGPRVNRRWRGF